MHNHSYSKNAEKSHHSKILSLSTISLYNEKVNDPAFHSGMQLSIRFQTLLTTSSAVRTEVVVTMAVTPISIANSGKPFKNRGALLTLYEALLTPTA